MRKASVVLLAALSLTTYKEGIAEARHIVDSTPISGAWYNNVIVVSAIADDGTLWAATTKGLDAFEWTDIQLFLSFPSRTTWIQLPQLPGGRYPYKVMPVDNYIAMTGTIYSFCLATDGTIWALIPMLSDIFRGTSIYYSYNPEWFIFPPPLPQPEPTADAGVDSSNDLTCDLQ